MVQSIPWYDDALNYLIISGIPKGSNQHDKDRFLHLVNFYIRDDPYLLNILLIKLLAYVPHTMRLGISRPFIITKATGALKRKMDATTVL